MVWSDLTRLIRVTCGGLLIFGLSFAVWAADSGSTETTGLLAIPDYSAPLPVRSHLSGDWGGTRTQLAEKGVQLDVQWTQVGQALDGGSKSVGKYGGSLDYDLNLDLMKMGVLPGALIHIKGESRYGESVNAYSGLILPVNLDASVPTTTPADEPLAFALTDLNWIQFLNDHFALMIGKFDTFEGDGSEFASGRGVSQFMNFNLVYNGTTAMLPYCTLGAGVLVLPNKSITINSMVANLSDSSTTTGFEDFGEGWIWSSEMSVQYRLSELPGGVNIGAVFSFDGDFSRLDKRFTLTPGEGLNAPTEDSSWTTYMTGWQYLFVEDAVEGPVDAASGRPDHQGLGVFARLGFADEKTNPIELSSSIGLGGRGLLPGRDNDVFGVGYYYQNLSETRIGESLGYDTSSQGAEAFYNLALAESTTLGLDFQYVDSPAPDVRRALILGARMNILF